MRSTASATRYTLDQLLARVQRDYPGVVAARESLHASEAQLAQAQRLWAPTGDITFWMTGAPNIKCADQNGVSNPDPGIRQRNCVSTNVVDFGRAANYSDILPVHGIALNLSMNIIQPLYTFGKIEALTAAAKSGIDAAKGGVDAAKADVSYNAVRAYWGLKWARAATATIEEGREKLSEWITRIDNALGGTNKQKYTEADLARLKIALDNAELLLVDVRRGLMVADSALKKLTDDQEADVDEEELTIIEPISRPQSYYQEAAIIHRPEVRMLDAAVGASQNWKKFKRAELLPDLGLLGNFTYGYASSIDSPANGFLPRPNVLGGALLLTLRAPLDFAVKAGRLQQASAEERAWQARRRQALGGISIEIDFAYANYTEATARAEKTRHGEKVARGWYNAADQAMSAGLNTEVRELTDAARNYFEFRVRHLQAIMDSNIALSWLRRISGMDLTREPS